MKLNLVLFNFLRETDGTLDVAASNEYFYQIYLPVIIWLVLVLILLIILLRKYTLKEWTVENPNPYSSESFGMPRGTFRTILTLTLLFVVVILELVSVHTIGFEENISEFLTAFQMMIAFYFGSKVMHHIASTDQKKAKLVSEETKGRSELIKTIATDQKVERKEIEKKQDKTINNTSSLKSSSEITADQMYDDGIDEGSDDEAFDEEVQFGGDDPDAKG